MVIFTCVLLYFTSAKRNFTEGRMLISGALKCKACKEEERRKLNEKRTNEGLRDILILMTSHENEVY